MSHVNSFAHVVVANAPEVYENFEVVNNEAVCDNVCTDEDLIVDMISDQKAFEDIGCIEDDVVLNVVKMVHAAEDDVAYVDVELGKVIEEVVHPWPKLFAVFGFDRIILYQSKV